MPIIETLNEREKRLAVEKERKEIIALGEAIIARSSCEVVTAAARDFLNAIKARS